MNKSVKIQEHIKTLLFEYSPVIVPGLGAFTTRYKPAQLNEALGKLSPPVKALEFNPQVTVNDGLLVGHVARQLKVKESVAELEIKWFVNSLFAAVEREGKVKVEGLGDFFTDNSGRLLFTPIENLNYSTDTYGLEPVALREEDTVIPAAGVGISGLGEKKDVPDSAALLHQETDEQEKVSTFSDVLLSPPPIIKNEERTDSGTLFERLSKNADNSGRIENISAGSSLNDILAANDSSPVDEKPKKKQKGALGIWTWLLPLLMLGLFLLLINRLSSEKSWREKKPFSYIFGTNKKMAEQQGQEDMAITAKEADPNATAAQLDTASTETAAPEQQETTTPTATNESIPQEEVELGPNQKMIDGLRVTESGADEYANGKQTSAGYYIIVGSWKNKDKAREVAKQYQQYGYKTHLLETMTGNLRIGIYGPQDIPTIKQEFARVREKYNPDAWVMKFS